MSVLELFYSALYQLTANFVVTVAHTTVQVTGTCPQLKL